MSPRTKEISLIKLAGQADLDAGLEKDVMVTGLAYDSRVVQPGNLFFALPGHTVDGHDFVAKAEKSGALAAVVERKVNSSLIQIVVPSVFSALSKISAAYFDSPTRSLPVIGVTGTNGKTTVTYLLEKLFQRLGRKCGVMGTINYRFDGQCRPAPNTTPLPLDIQSFANDVRDGGGVALIMEVSSHALALGRVNEVNFRTAVFTNLTQDHLDFHKTMEAYFGEKEKLFSWNESLTRAVNVDDPYGLRLLKKFPDAIGFGVSKNASLRADHVSIGMEGNRFELTAPSGKRFEISTNLIGAHNVSNLLAAGAAALAHGLSEEEVAMGLNQEFSIPGRLEKINQGQPFVAVIDYAHTPDALEKALVSLKELKPKKLIAVFGAGGDRDKTKRPLMGRVSADLADLTFVTSDNPRTENPSAILKDIEKGISENRKKNVVVIEDRKKAILDAVKAAEKGDIVLVAGKGHEDYQIIGTTKHHFSDKETVVDALKECGYK